MRLLIVTHDFPPLNSVASHRPFSWARTWTDRGHEVHVLTTRKYAHEGPMDLAHDLSGIAVHTVDYLPLKPAGSPGGVAGRATGRLASVKRATRAGRLALGMFANAATLAYPALVRRGLTLLREQRFDAIVTTSGPDVCPMVGARLKRATGIFWLSDYRDMWLPEYAIGRLAIVSRLTGAVQRSLVRQASALCTVSRGLAEAIREETGREVWIAYNGFFGEARPAGASAEAAIRIVYTGTLHPDTYDPALFFRGLRILLDALPSVRNRLSAHFFGTDEPWLRKSAEAHGLDGLVEFHGRIPHEQSVEAQRSAGALLFVDWLDTRARGVLTGKLFEYLASGRPIICVSNRPDSEPARLIQDCRAGWVCTSADQTASTLRGIVEGTIGAEPDLDRIRSYSRAAQAEGLLRRLEAATRSGSP